MFEQFMSVIDTYFELVSYVVVIVAAGVAIWGINAWRREFVGKRRIELAEDVLALFYEAVDAIKAIRMAGVYSNEGDSYKPHDSESPEEIAINRDAFVTYERDKMYHELFGRIRAVRYRFAAYFGKDKTEPIDDLLLIRQDILRAANKMAKLEKDYLQILGNLEQEKKLGEKIGKQRLILYSYGNEDDPINKQILEVEEAIESTCREVIDNTK
jgi:hypothetical protein